MTSGIRANVVVEGEAAAHVKLERLAAGLADPTEANRAAAEQLLGAARPHTPYVSGFLAQSGRVEANAEEGIVEYAAIYAGKIHNGWPERNIHAQPWLRQTADADTGPIAEVFVGYLDGLVA